MFTRSRRPMQDNICPFVYHYFMIFLKQRTFEIQLKAIKVHMVSITKPKCRGCNVGLRRHGQVPLSIMHLATALHYYKKVCRF